MSTYRIVVVVGSLRRESINKQLAQALVGLGPSDFQFEFAEIGDLPLYNQDDDADQPAPTKRLKAQVEAAQGVIFVTPEYNRSIPGVLKNAIDHASRPYGQSAWRGKPGGVIGASTGAMGTSLAQQHLRNILSAQGMLVLASPEAFVQITPETYQADGTLSERTATFLAGWMDAFAAMVRRLSD